ncbi:LacI family DNA-binding transcriptional regulator [Cereibacter sediminicola]|uniref:LacI family DNA-binding transcriptional regulator n=1 Tax=Cereibacter sediminicola TaxID=2584941 RepID=UPI0011A4E0A7|nr:LacI family DNA-binding transcriptional regulator [Cereibacter sediminicola]
MSGDRPPRAVKRAVTVKDVAAAANVSRATAARALNGYGYVGDEASRRVQEAAERLGYRGNRIAQALRQGQMPIVGFVPGDIQNPFFARVAHDIDAALRRSRHSLLIASSEESLSQEQSLLDNLRALNVRGMIVAPASEGDNPHLQRLVRERVPLVLIDRELPGIDCDSVTVDNEGGAREAIALLIANGHRRIALIHDESRIATARQRREGYLRALAEAGLPVEEGLIAVSQSTVEHAIDATIRLFSRPERPTALFTVDSLMTTGALLALRSMGLAVPRDVSLIGFDDFDLATFTDPQITVVAQPVGQIGPLAVEMLLERIRGSDAPARHVRFPTRLITRGSVARADFGRRAGA